MLLIPHVFLHSIANSHSLSSHEEVVQNDSCPLPTFTQLLHNPSRHLPPSQTHTPNLSKLTSLTNAFLPRIQSPIPLPKLTTVLPTPTSLLNFLTTSPRFASPASSPTSTTPRPPHLSQTMPSNMPTKHHGNCSTSASNACNVSLATWAYFASSRRLARRCRFEALILLEDGSVESIPVLSRRRSDGGGGDGVVKNPEAGGERKSDI